MKTIYFVSDDLDELEKIETELSEKGLKSWQFRTLSSQDSSVAEHHLHAVPFVEKKDIGHMMEYGAVAGAIAATIVLLAGKATGASDELGWGIFLAFAVLAFGFCIWESILVGQHKINHKFKRFKEHLKSGKHIFIVEANDEEVSKVKDTVLSHDHLKPA